MIVYRGLDLTGSPELAQGFLASCQNSLLTGEPLALPGYTPCTINAQAEFFGNVKMTIEAASVVMVGKMEALLDCDSGVVVRDIRQMPNGWEIIAQQIIAGEQEGQSQEQQVPAEQKGIKAGPPIAGRRASGNMRTGNRNKDDAPGVEARNSAGIYMGDTTLNHPHVLMDSGNTSLVFPGDAPYHDVVTDVQDEEPTPREPDPEVVEVGPMPYPTRKGMKAARIIGVGDNGYRAFNVETGIGFEEGVPNDPEENMNEAQHLRTSYGRRRYLSEQQPNAVPNYNDNDVGKDAAPAIIDARTNKIKPQRTPEEQVLIGVSREQQQEPELQAVEVGPMPYSRKRFKSLRKKWLGKGSVGTAYDEHLERRPPAVPKPPATPTPGQNKETEEANKLADDINV